MYDPEDNTVLITEIYYEAETAVKLGSKMNTLSYTVIPEEIKKHIEAAASKSYMESVEMPKAQALVYQNEINMYGKPEKLYFEYTVN